MPEIVVQKKVCVVCFKNKKKYKKRTLIIGNWQSDLPTIASLCCDGAEMEKEADAADMFVLIYFHLLNFFLLYKRKNMMFLFDLAYFDAICLCISQSV